MINGDPAKRVDETFPVSAAFAWVFQASPIQEAPPSHQNNDPDKILKIVQAAHHLNAVPQPYPVQRHSKFTLGVCALILLGMLFGAFISSMGGVTSHGLAAFAATQHKLDGISVDAHGHSHDDDDAKPAFTDAGTDHAHHGADHSHDKSHVPFSPITIATSMAASRPATARSWVELVEAFRLERPPMA